MEAGDPRDLYQRQLRFAENVLAFLASVSLALLREEDRERAGLDLRKYWSGGISPGDWKDVVQKCSKVFAGYRDVPLATAIYKLKIGAEQRGFGRDVIELIRAKNDFKHDRGPTGPEEFAKASDEAQGNLRRCMEALDFLADYPMREAESVGDPFLELGDGRVTLYPFVTSAACPRRGGAETYFVDAWDTRKGISRLKSFENGHTRNSPEVSEALAAWMSART